MSFFGYCLPEKLDLMADDSFEAARKAFFGAEKTTVDEKALTDKIVKPQNEPIASENPSAAFEGQTRSIPTAGQDPAVVSRVFRTFVES